MTEGSVERPSSLVAGQPLDAGDAIYRRIANSSPNMISIDAITGVRRPTSGVFKPDVDGVSCYAESALSAAGLAAVDILRRRGNIVARLEVDEMRTLGAIEAIGDPWPGPETFSDPSEADHARNVAHALIVGLQDLGKAARTELQRRLAQMTTLTLLEPDFHEDVAED